MRFSEDFKLFAEYKLDATFGIMIHPVNGKLYYAYSRCTKNVNWRATAYPLADDGLQRCLVKKRPIKNNPGC